MFRSKAFSARPAYFLSTVKSRPDIAMDLCHGKEMLTFSGKSLDRAQGLGIYKILYTVSKNLIRR
jgi:hypothetical protein